MQEEEYRSGFVTLLGKPNVGKSTLLNRLVEKKISITSRKPQTTRHRILGIVTGRHAQIAFVDTPGAHKAQTKTINKVINRTTRRSVEDVDAVVLMITHRGWFEEDRFALSLVRDASIPVVLTINKIDLKKDKSALLPLIAESSRIHDFREIIPLSARSGHNTDTLVEVLGALMPPGPAGFPGDQITDSSDRFIATELIREQVFRLLGDELPYTTAVHLTRFEDARELLHLEADIWVDRENHKAIVIGENGAQLGRIGRGARKGIAAYFSKKVYLKLFVKVRKNWADNKLDLNSLGYLG